MATKSNISLCISLFYNKTDWSIIINKGLVPFIESENMLDSYFLRLSEEMGDHIKVVLITDNSNARFLAEKIDVWFKDFFIRNPSISTDSPIPKQGLFMKFPNNRIHYGVFDNVFIRDPKDTFRIYLKNTSVILLKVFNSYGCGTLDNLMEIMLQIFAIFCNTARIKSQSAAKIYDSILESEYKKYDSEVLNRIRRINMDNFEKNKTPILDYLNQINKSNLHLLNEEWQIGWSLTVKTCCESLRKMISEEKMNVEYIYMINAVFDTFGFKERISACFLFSSALKEI